MVPFIVTVLRARPSIACNSKKQPRVRVCQLAWSRCSYTARAIIARFFGIAKRHYHLNTADTVGWEPVLLRVTLTFCAILVVAVAAQHARAPELRLSPTRVLAHYLPCRRSPD